jgi:glycosyltransferase involved in cell wall biosynthesis
MKISVLSNNLSNNGFGRAFVLADILSRKYDVEIIGPVKGSGIWAPLRNCKLKIKTVPYRKFPGFIASAVQMLKLIDGDVIYAIKPKLSTLIIALIKRFRTRKPVIIDIDDWEAAFHDFSWSILDMIGEFGDPDSMLYSRIAEKLVKYADGLTVVSEFLRKTYGLRGIIVPHGRDLDVFDPAIFSKDEQKRKYNLEKYKLIVFVGTVLPHKGVENIIEAIKILNDKSIKLVIFATENARIRRLKENDPDIVTFLGPVEFDSLPEKLSMADLIVIPQKDEPVARGQVPAKLIDAMAMAKPIISTKVSDIPKILDGCGIVVEPDDTNALAKNIKYILDNPAKAEEMGRAARIKCEKYFSYEAVGNILYNVFDKYSNNIKEIPNAAS